MRSSVLNPTKRKMSNQQHADVLGEKMIIIQSADSILSSHQGNSLCNAPVFPLSLSDSLAVILALSLTLTLTGLYFLC